MYQIILYNDKQKNPAFLQENAVANWQTAQKCVDCMQSGNDNACSVNIRGG